MQIYVNIWLWFELVDIVYPTCDDDANWLAFFAVETNQFSVSELGESEKS